MSEKRLCECGREFESGDDYQDHLRFEECYVGRERGERERRYSEGLLRGIAERRRRRVERLERKSAKRRGGHAP